MRKTMLIALVITSLFTYCSGANAQTESPAKIDMDAQLPPPGPPLRVDGPAPETVPLPKFVPPPPGPPVPIGGPNVAPQPQQIYAPPPPPRYSVDGPFVAPVQPQVFAPSPLEYHSCGWVSVDYLLWWVKPGPNPNPLVTTGNPNDPMPGALGSQGPNTQVLFGGHNLDYGSCSGVRFDVGFWLPQCPLIGFDAGFFALQTRTVGFTANSDDNGNPVLGRPFVNAQNGQETVYIDSLPGVAAGGVTVASSTQLYSWEFNVVANMLHSSNFSWNLLGGFRALNLTETLSMQDVFFPLNSGAGFTFLGAPVDPSSTVGDFDRFHTTNNFYGGQIGSRVDWRWRFFDFSVTGKVAIGVTQQSINIDGYSMLVTPGSPTITAPGGIFAQPTNMGRTSRDVFTVVPELGFNCGYQITPWLRAQVGYTALYWSNVVRPGNQIDRTINPTQVPTDNSFGSLTGPARPGLTPQTTDFWAQGINFGLEFRF